MAMILGGGLLVVLGIANALVLWRAQRWFYDWQVGQMARFGNWVCHRVLGVDPPVGMNPFGGFQGSSRFSLSAGLFPVLQFSSVEFWWFSLFPAFSNGSR